MSPVAFDEKTLAEIVRTRLGDVDGSRRTRIIWSIGQALDALSRTVATNPRKRHLLQTPRESTSCLLSSGSVDLEAKRLDGTLPNLIREYLKLGSIWYAPVYSFGFLGTAIHTSVRATGTLTISAGTERATGTLTIAQGVAARGTLTVTAQPTNGETINVNGVVWTFRTALIDSGNEVLIGANLNATTVNLAAALNASTNGAISVATYTAGAAGQIDPEGSSDGDALAVIPIPPTIVTITYDTFGTAGNAFTLANSSGGHVVRGAATLAFGVNGVVEGETLNINGVAAIFRAAISDTAPPPIQVLFYASATQTAAALVTALNASTNTYLTPATYSSVGNVITVSYDRLGYLGNTYTLFNSSAGAVTRSNTTLTGGVGGVVEGETISINGVTITFSNFIDDDTHVQFTADPDYTATLLTTKLNASVNVGLSVATYTHNANTDNGIVTITYDTPGTGGNGYTLANSSLGNVTRSGATLAGGAGGNVTVIDATGHTFSNLDAVRWTVTDGDFPTTTPVQIDATTQLYVVVNSATSISLSTTANGSSLITFTDNGADANAYELAGPTDAIDGEVQRLPNPAFADMEQTFSADYRYYWLDGSLLRIKGLASETDPIDGYLYFACPYQPTMADFASEQMGYKLAELHEDLIKKTIEICTGPGVED